MLTTATRCFATTNTSAKLQGIGWRRSYVFGSASVGRNTAHSCVRSANMAERGCNTENLVIRLTDEFGEEIAQTYANVCSRHLSCGQHEILNTQFISSEPLSIKLTRKWDDTVGYKMPTQSFCVRMR